MVNEFYMINNCVIITYSAHTFKDIIDQVINEKFLLFVHVFNNNFSFFSGKSIFIGNRW